MKKVGAVLILITVVALLFGFGMYRKSSGRILVDSKVMEEIILDNHSEIDFNKLVDEEWETGYIFTPYTTDETIDKTLGFRFNKSTSIETNDSINLVVFTKGNKVVKYAEVPRKYGDFQAEKFSSENPVVGFEK